MHEYTTLHELLYLGAAVCFIVGIKRLSKPATAANGNLLAAVGMLVAVVAMLMSMDPSTMKPEFIITGVVVGTAIGLWMAVKVEMTGMPEMVALFNGFGGAASALVAWAHYQRKIFPGPEGLNAAGLEEAIPVLLSVWVGALTLTGSLDPREWPARVDLSLQG